MSGNSKVDWVAVGRYIANHRLAARLTKKAAASRAGIADMTWRKLEAGDVTGIVRDHTLIGVAEALDVDPEELFRLCGRDYEAPPPRRAPVVDSLEADPNLNRGDRRLLVQLYERLSR